MKVSKKKAALKKKEMSRTATALKSILERDKKLSHSFRKVKDSDKKLEQIGDVIKDYKLTRSIFVDNAFHHFLRLALCEYDLLGKSEGLISMETHISKLELGVLYADDFLATAHPKLKVAKKMNLLPPQRQEPRKRPTAGTRVTILVLGNTGRSFLKKLKQLRVDVPTYKKSMTSRFWGE